MTPPEGLRTGAVLLLMVWGFAATSAIEPPAEVGGDWPVTESRFLRYHIEPGGHLDEPARAVLDSFVSETCGRLGISSRDVQRLESQKIDYYFCEPASVARMAGAPTQGVALLQEFAVATCEPVHLHELAHLLVNYADDDLPLYTLPVLQEGIAVHLGGRWGRSAPVMAALGRFVLDSGFVAVADMLSWEGFRRDLPDLTYAPAGVLAGFLLQELGPEGFRALYRDFSGDPDFLVGLTSLQIRQVMESRLGLPDGGLEAALGAYADRIPRAGFETFDSGPAPPDMVLEAPGCTVSVYVSEVWIGFDITVGEGPAEGVVSLVPVPAGKGTHTYGGRLFGEILPGASYAGEVAALVFKPGEAGYYDFTLDSLTAKHVQDFRPLPGYFDQDARRYLFRLRRDLFPPDPDRFEWRLDTP